MTPPFEIGQPGERWHYRMDGLCIPVDPAEPDGKCVFVFYRDDQYLFIASQWEHKTPDLLMMACYVEDFLQHYKDNCHADV